MVLIAYNNDLGAYNVPVLAPGKMSVALVQCSTIGPALGFHLTVWGAARSASAAKSAFA